MADNYFKYLSNEPMPVIPAGAFETLELKTARELMDEREAWIASTKKCECCGGRGRVLK